MPIRTILTLLVAAVLGVAAVLLTRNYLGHQRANIVQTQAQGMSTVVVAAQPLARGVLLTPSVLKVASYPTSAVPAGAFSTIQQATAGGDRRALRNLAANEPILPDRITAPGGRASLSAQLTPGMRAVTFRSNDVAGVAGFVLPGDRVDVMLTRTVSGGAGGQDNTITQVVAGNVKVLGIDQVVNETMDKPTVAKAITLELTPDQAQALPLAESLGTVSLALRHISDELPLTRTVTTVSDLGAGPYRAAPVYRAAAATPMGTIRHAVAHAIGSTVKVTRGVETTSYSVGN
jgi:pilus assembly protein CpaB